MRMNDDWCDGGLRDEVVAGDFFFWVSWICFWFLVLGEGGLRRCGLAVLCF